MSIIEVLIPSEGKEQESIELVSCEVCHCLLLEEQSFKVKRYGHLGFLPTIYFCLIHAPEYTEEHTDEKHKKTFFKLVPQKLIKISPKKFKKE